MGFNTNYNEGFQIHFKNGYYVSCQFGRFNYCSRRSFYFCSPHSGTAEGHVFSEDCELAVVNSNIKGKASDAFITGKVIRELGLNIDNDGMVAGYVSAEDAAKIIGYVQSLEAKEND